MIHTRTDNIDNIWTAHLYFNAQDYLDKTMPEEYVKIISPTQEIWWNMYDSYTETLKPYSRRTNLEWWEIFFMLRKHPQDNVLFKLTPRESKGFDTKLQKKIKLEYRRYGNSHCWKETRTNKLESVNHECEVCGATENLQIHHLSYYNVGMEELEELEVLCQPCHYNEHRVELKYKTPFSRSTIGYHYEKEESETERRIKTLNKGLNNNVVVDIKKNKKKSKVN